MEVFCRVRMTYDSIADAAYIYVSEKGGSAETHETSGPSVEGAAIILAYDGEAHLLGIEILGASRLLLADTLAGAEQIA